MNPSAVSVCLASSAAVILCASPREASAQAREELEWGEPVALMKDDSGRQVRVQCDEATKRCLVAPNCAPATGTALEPCRDLERLNWNSRHQPDDAYQKLEAEGYVMVQAGAETPPGWYRDEAGRVMQVNFDLNRRVWLGAAYGAAVGPGNREVLASALLEAGLRAEILSDDARVRYRFHTLPSRVSINPLTVDATLFAVDNTYTSKEPTSRLTTFFGTPERHDLYMDIGWWAELARVEHAPRGVQEQTNLRILAAGASWDMWNSPDLSSFLRLRSGLSLDDLISHRKDDNGGVALSLLSYLEGDFTVDRNGHHRVTAHSGVEGLFVWTADGPDEPQSHLRFLNEVAYEVILLAINDQPLTLRAAVGGGYRDDVWGTEGWEFTAGVGMRASLWAPPREIEAMDKASDRRARGLR